jgi:ATP-dependent exoDNAse (exonuclease V) alpha subunit
MFHLNEGQEQIVSEAVDWYKNSSEQVFQFDGRAGTGKSVVLNAIIKRLKLDLADIAPMSYIGAAAIVMRLKGFYNAKTIHSWLFESKVVYDETNMDNYLNRPKPRLIFVPKPLGDKKLICIDEAGSVPFSLKKELESRRVKIIACGDLNQLPPPCDTPAYLYSGKVRHLTQIMRQSKFSAIIYIADRILQGYKVEPGFYGNVMVIYDDQLTSSMLLNAEVVICGKNITREKFNRYIRKSLLNIEGKLPSHGERVICRKNNWQVDANGINLANGLIGTVISYPSVYGFDGKIFEIDFKPDLFNGIFKSLSCDFKYFNASPQDRDKIKRSPFSEGEKFELAYAITTHISQGSQYRNGIYYEEYLNQNINKNLNYTGITRFSDWCIYVIPTPKYY